MRTQALSQDPNHFIIGEDELSGINVYSLFYNESSQVLYAGTNNGLYAYKQSRFNLLKGPRKTNGESFFHITKSPSGELFCCNLTGQIFKIEENQFKLYCTFPKEEIGSYFKFEFDKKGNLYGVSNKVMKHDAVSNEISIISINEHEPGFCFINVNIIDDVMYASTSKAAFVVPIESPEKSFRISSLDLGEGIFQGIRGVYKMSGRIVALLNSGEYVNLLGKHELVNKGKRKILERTYFVGNNQLIGMGRNRGIRLLNFRNDSLIASETYFNEEMISSHYVSSDETYFLGTFGSGVKIIPKLSVLKESINAELSGIESVSGDTVYISSYSGDVFRNVNGKTSKIAHYNENIDNLYQIPFSVDGMADKYLMHNSIKVFSGVKDYDVIDSTRFLYCNQGGIHLVSNTDVNAINQNSFRFNGLNNYCIHAQNERVFAVKWVEKDSSIYYSSNFGVFHYSLKTKALNQLKINNESISTYVLAYNNGLLYCGTNDYGIVIFKDDKELKRIDIKDGLKSSTIKNVKIYGDKLYVLTLKGLQVYDLVKQKVLDLGVAEGLIDNTKVERFVVKNEKLWILEKNGFYSIKIDDQMNARPISNIHFDSVTVNNRKIDYYTETSFSHDENAFEFYFDYRDILSKHETQIIYKLEGFYDEWKVLDGKAHVIKFQSLPAGNYVFILKAKSEQKFSEEFKYSFQVHPPIWYHWWFTTSIVLIVITVIVFYYRGRLKQQNEKLQLINKFDNAKLTAIQSQMNPHFIFNSLNSIQALVLKGDIDNSYTYINKFSSLVRKTMLYSDLEFIEIENEIELLNIYLELEKLRFREEFEYEIDDFGCEDISVPPMFIQPFVENAIVHGLLHKDGLKKLKISFEIGDVLTCTIEDNGVGREASKAINERQRSDHESFAIKSINTRIMILRKTFDSNIGFEYEDLIDGEHVLGTRVILKIPFNSKFS